MHWLAFEKQKANRLRYGTTTHYWSRERFIATFSKTPAIFSDVPIMDQVTLKAKFWAANIGAPFEGKAMGMDTVGTMQQPKPIGSGADINDLVMSDLLARKQAGTKKYGTALKANNGRSALVDAYQECLDLCLYLRQAIEEENGRQQKNT